jgi:CRP-like cAMP-binding protein
LVDIFGGRASVTSDVSLVTVGLNIYAACVLLLALCGLFGGVFLLGLEVIGRALHGLRPQRPIVRVAPSPEARARFEDQVQRIPFLSSLGPEVLDAFVATARHESYGPRRVIIKQGLLGDSFYWIAQGRCAVEVEELSGRVHRVAMLEAGDFFGEVALVHEVRRTATVRSLDAVSVMSFHRDDFLPLLARAGVPHTQVVRDIRNAAFLRGLPLFAHMPGESLSALLARLTELELAAGDPIVVQGEEADGMYVLREGEAVVEREEPDGVRLEVAHFEAGAWFGEIALLTGGRRTATVRALTDLVVLRIPRDAFRDVLMRHFATAVLLDHRCAARLDALEISDQGFSEVPDGVHSPSSTAR